MLTTRMRRHLCVLLLSCPLLAGIGCWSRREPQPSYRPDPTIKDIMLSIVDPQSDVVFNSVATIVTIAGTEERQPRTEEEWAAVRRGAIQLIEVTNLLLIPGRQVARPGERSQNPKVELHPETIQTLIRDDPQTWTKLVGGLHDAAVPALKAVDEKNVQGLFDAGDELEKACENCHRQYWYPPGHAPAWKAKSEQ